VTRELPTARFCYPDYTDGQEETTFVKNWKSTEAVDTTEFDSSVQDAFKWKSTSETGEFFIFPGVLGSYPGSGYVLDFATSSVERAQQLSNLQESHWIDIKTRAVFLDMAFYNPNTDMFVTIRMLFEFHACGFVSMMPTYRVMRLDKYPMNDFWNFLEIGAQGGVALMVRGDTLRLHCMARRVCDAWTGALLHHTGVARDFSRWA
jgi:hypothetical protein